MAKAAVQAVWERSVAATARSSEDVQFWASLALTSASVATQLCSLLLLVVGVFMILDGKLSVGALVAANMLSGRVLGPIAGIAAVMTRATQTSSALRSINRLMGLERERPPEKIYVAREIKQGRIEFKNVSFSYPNSPAKALDGISFAVKAGEKIGIIGRVGSGKTTVGRLATAFYPPSEGSILIDGVDIRQYDPADLRAGIGFVLQDTDLFYGKLRDNITLGRPGCDRRGGVGRRTLVRCRNFHRRSSARLRHDDRRGRAQPVRRPETGDRARTSADPQAPRAVPR